MRDRVKPKAAAFLFVSLIEEVLEMARAAAAHSRRRTRFGLSLSGEEIVVLGDPDHVEAELMNVLLQALEWDPAPDQICISVQVLERRETAVVYLSTLDCERFERARVARYLASAGRKTPSSSLNLFEELDDAAMEALGVSEAVGARPPDGMFFALHVPLAKDLE